MANKLIIVESPNKIKTISGFLGNEYNIIATYGHFRELKKTGGYDRQTYEPRWEIIKDKKTDTSKEQIITQIKKAAAIAEEIYIATDPDREGEAIAWHVYDILPKSDQNKCIRITFNEITKKAILESINARKEIDMDLVWSQFARRIMDRLIGYRLSTFIKRSINAISAGRVQSVALLFVVNRELERRNFIPSKWFEVFATLDNGVKTVYTGNGDKYERYQEDNSSHPIEFRFANEKDAKHLLNELRDQYTLKHVDEPKETKADYLRPITTDKLLQLASNNFGWGANKTTFVAQKMFEGIDVDNQHIALISYPRTDSERLSEDFVREAFEFIEQKYGGNYVSHDYARNINKKAKGANFQDAHEAIRPVDITLTPEKIKPLVDDQVFKLYTLIWSRTMASLMKVPLMLKYNLYFDNNGHEFFTSYKELKFDGYYALDFYANVRKEYEKPFPKMVVSNQYPGEAELVQKDKLPPPYYTEATLIKALKDSGVGRPSTYAKMASIGEERGYVYKKDGKLIPTDMGMNVISSLQKDFEDVITPEFTANMETELDKIAHGELQWKTYLHNFAPSFEEKVKESYKNIVKEEPQKTNRICPKCKENELLLRVSRYGTKFIACSGFPKCKYVENVEGGNSTGEICPECGHDLVIKVNKKKQSFVGCSNYPNCTYIKPSKDKK